MLTYQDYITAPDAAQFIASAIAAHIEGAGYREAVLADQYDRQQNATVNSYPQLIAEHAGEPLLGATMAGNRIASNFFHMLNEQRCAYLLGNGVYFVGGPATKGLLGRRFDRDFFELGRLALIHGTAFALWDAGRLRVFPLTQFVPLYDERTGVLRAGIRFWQLDASRRMQIELYDEAGMTRYACDGDCGSLVMTAARRPYLTRGVESAAGGFEPVGGENYDRLPIIVMHGSRLKQSTLVGLRRQIDAYDLIQSGFANDLMECAQIYWVIDNYGGMQESDLKGFLKRLARQHVAMADTRGMGAESGGPRPVVVEVPYQSRMAWLNHVRGAIYEGFGALDVQALSSGKRTATEIAAAYQPLDAAADDFEAQCTDAIQQLLDLLGVDDEPVYKRDRVADVYEQTKTVMLAKDVLDRKTVVRKLPWITVDEAEEILRDGEG